MLLVKENLAISMNLEIDFQRRYEKFIKRVREHAEVWGLKSEDGWAIVESNTYEDTGVMLFWSDKAYAKQCAAEEWNHYIPTLIALENFSTLWLPGLDEDELLVRVNWTKDLIGLETEPLELLNNLQKKP